MASWFGKIPIVGKSGLVARNTGVLIAGEFACRVIAFFTFLLVARYLGVESFGKYSFVFSFLSFFDILAMFGMNAIVVREMAANPVQSANILKNALALRSFFILAAILCACILAMSLPLDPGVKALTCLGALGLAVSYRPILESIFRIRMRMGIPVLTSIVKALLFAACALLIAWRAGGLGWFILASVGANLAGTFVLTGFAMRQQRPAGPVDWDTCRHLLAESLPMVLSGILTILYIRVDVMMLTFWKGFQSVGFYSAATKLSEALAIVPTALLMTLFPILSGYAKENRQRFEEILNRGFLYLLVFIVPVSLLIRCYAPGIVRLLFDSGYASSAPALSILVLSCVLVYPNILMVNALIALRKQIFDTWFSLASVLANVLLNFWWIPRFSFLGAAWATVGSELVQFLCLSVYLQKVHAVAIPWGLCLRLIALALILYGGLAATIPAVSWMIAVPVFLGLYIGGLFLSGIMKGQDRQFLSWTLANSLRFRGASTNG